jgi:hypothetical protein
MISSFIVISADNRLHYIVDGIEKCRPQNASTITNISTGKIVKTDLGYTYEYQIFGKHPNEKELKPFSYLIANQLAAFRNACGIPKKDTVNIFFLENLLTQNDLYNNSTWIEELEKVFNESDPHFCLFRVAFVYDIEKPYNVNAQIDCDVLEALLSEHKLSIQNGFQRYIFYIDNQKFGAAALCLSKEDQDLKLPRILMDFMMLVSNSNNKYNVMQAIDSPTERTNCFSIGYAESMYYYPDVERYFIHADSRELQRRFLTDEDETNDDTSNAAMDVEKYPFGLYARQDKLAAIYEDVPFSVDINLYPLTADKTIDDCVVALKEYILNKRKKECEAFGKAEEERIESVKCDLEKINKDIDEIAQNEDESDEDFTKRKQIQQEKRKGLEKELESIEEGIVSLVEQFEANLPRYIDRTTIYQDICVAEDADSTKENEEQEYRELLKLIVSKEFLDFVREDDSASTKDTSEEKVKDLNTQKVPSEKSFWRCIIDWIKSLWRRLIKRHRGTEDEGNSENKDEVMDASTAQKSGTDYITTIKEQLKLKADFKNFKEVVADIQNWYNDENEYCENFKLTDHSNHYYPLIDLPKLKEEYNKTYQQRVLKVINLWQNSRDKTKSTLTDAIRKEAEKYTKQNFLYIDWNKPFSFVSKLDATDNMPDICNRLQNRADPFVDFNQPEATDRNIFFRYMYSDRPNFEDEFVNIMKHRIENSNQISAICSSHIESKICFMEILPMDNQVLENLILKKKNGDYTPFEEGKVEEYPGGATVESPGDAVHEVDFGDQ